MNAMHSSNSPPARSGSHGHRGAGRAIPMLSLAALTVLLAACGGQDPAQSSTNAAANEAVNENMVAEAAAIALKTGPSADFDANGVPLKTIEIRFSHSGKCLGLFFDTKDKAGSPGSVIQHGCGPSKWDNWTLLPGNTADYYKIRNQHSGMCLTTTMTQGQPVMQFPCVDTDRFQNFTFRHVTGNRWQIRNQVTGQCIDNDGQNVSHDGMWVYYWNCTDWADALFYIEGMKGFDGDPELPGKPGTGILPPGNSARIIARTSEKCLVDSNTNPVQKTCTPGGTTGGSGDTPGLPGGDTSMRWDLYRHADGYYELKEQSTKRCLNVVGGGAYQAPRMDVTGCNRGSANQQWRLIPRELGYYSLYNKATGHCAILAGGSKAENAGVGPSDCSEGNVNQHWRIPGLYGNPIRLAPPGTPIPGEPPVSVTPPTEPTPEQPPVAPPVPETPRPIPPAEGTMMYILKAGNSHLCADNGGAAGFGQAPVQQACGDTTNHRWYPYYVGSHVGLLSETGFCLSAGATSGTEVPVQMQNCTGAENQLWSHQVMPVSGLLRFINKANNLCLAVSASSKTPSTRLVVTTCADNTPAQLWNAMDYPSAKDLLQKIQSSGGQVPQGATN